MNLTTFLIVVTIYIICIVIGMFIEDNTYKLYFYMIVALGTLCYLNIYLMITKYIYLRNDPGIPGPRGPKGEKGATGPRGKCVNTNKCGFTDKEIDELLYNKAVNIFNTSIDCVKDPTLDNCTGGAQEVERISKVNAQMKMLEDYAKSGQYSRQQFIKQINDSFGNL